MSRQARAFGVSLVLHGAALLIVCSLCGGAASVPARSARVIDLRLLDPEPEAARPAASPAVPPPLSRPRAPAPAPAQQPEPIAQPRLQEPPPSFVPSETAAAPTAQPAPEAEASPPVGSEGGDPVVVPVAGMAAIAVSEAGGLARTVEGAPASAAEGSGAATSVGSAAERSNAPPGEGLAAVPRDFAALREIVQRHLVYPSLARRMGWEGKVTLSFIVCSDGRAREVAVRESSGRDLLDRCAVETVQKIAGLPASTTDAQVIVPVVYRLH